ncbi:MAG: hypothetical protein ACRC6I_03420 [Paracoccaceae bacterium]
MTSEKRLASLGQITEVILDQRLMALQAAQRARQATKARIAALDTAFTSDELALVAAERAQLLYQTWADRRRSQLNQTLAQQTVATMECEAAAREAFSRNTVLSGLRARLPAKPRS